MYETIQDQLEAVFRVGLAAILAGLLGLERQVADKPAGFRTHMLVGGSAALLVLLAQRLADYFAASVDSEVLRVDPLRVIEAIVVGVSFLGAGTILKVAGEHRVRYLTTAASILFSAGIGIAVAVQLHYLAVGVTMVVLVITYALGWVSRRVPHLRHGHDQDSR